MTAGGKMTTRVFCRDNTYAIIIIIIIIIIIFILAGTVPFTTAMLKSGS